MIRRLVLLPLVTACAGPGLEDGFLAELTRTGGCGDVFAFATDPAAERILEIHGDGWIADALDGGPTTLDLDLSTAPADEVTVEVRTGSRVDDAACDDVIENGGPQIDRTYVAVAGRLQVALTLGDTPEATTLDLQLSDLVVEPAEGGDAVEAGAVLSLEGLTVGWFAG